MLFLLIRAIWSHDLIACDGVVYGLGKNVGLGAGVPRVALMLLVIGVLSTPGARAQQPGRPTFKTGVEMVTINAVVRDHKGRIVSNLTRADFELLDNGRPQKIHDFRGDQAPITAALLFDTSGSMQVASKAEAARMAAGQMLSWLQQGRDEVAVFSFDSSLRELQPFTRDERQVKNSLGRVEDPFGMTSLRDAIAETARRVAARGGSHRAVVVFTDGVDNNSRLTPAEVSGIASSIDVPVYVIAVVSPLDHLGESSAVVEAANSPAGELLNLAQWTGGDAFMSSTPAQASLVVRQIVEELRFQYLIAFEPGGAPGWHPLEVRLRDRRLTVRARGGYFAGPSSGS